MSALAEPARTGRKVDPVTFEVIRHRLVGITEEQAARLMTVSGSKHVTEMSDYNVGLYLHDGSVAAMGRTILYHSSSMAALVRSVIADCTDEPGIQPGDIFIVNDPWKGSVHAPDMALIAPIHIDGRLIFWSGAMMHMSDIGGMHEGSVMLPASESYQEGLLLPPLKLASRGVLRQDVWRMVLANCRHASTMGLDLKGLMAANNAAVTGLQALGERYGVETLLDVMASLIELSETRLRARLAELPDAVIESTGFLEFDPTLGDCPVVHLELRKTGDHLILDFSKSSPQVPSSVNCTFGGLMAGVSAGLLPTLAYDIPWNEGLYRPLQVICPEGKVCNARRPAALSGNIAGGVWEVEMATTVALSRLAACSDKYRHEAQASSTARPGSLFFFGTNQLGERFAGRTYDVLGSGGGAYADHDGVSSHGHHSIERALISNVESLELDLPIMYLQRRWGADTGGAGHRRGGSSILSIYKPHRAKPTFQRLGFRWEVPDAIGLFGGLPGSQMGSELLRKTDVPQTLAGGHIPEFDEVKGERYVLPPQRPMAMVLDTDDLVRANPPGPAGWGDPLERSLDDLEIDLRFHDVSPAAAERLYGCAFDARGALDPAATVQRRAALREERKAWPKRKTRPAPPATALQTRYHMGDALAIEQDVTGAHWTVCSCGYAIAPAAENWREYAAWCRAEPDDIGVDMMVNECLDVRRYACPGCGRLHAVDLCRKTDPDPHDIRLQLE
ncbi:MAG: hydantoinase B/oxoprolinase family protein [Candidatus Lustribacter sp.]|jgi:N-methylhydantoinase B